LGEFSVWIRAKPHRPPPMSNQRIGHVIGWTTVGVRQGRIIFGPDNAYLRDQSPAMFMDARIRRVTCYVGDSPGLHFRATVRNATPEVRAMLRFVFGGCAALAVGVVSGWTALALRAPAPLQPAEVVSRQVPTAPPPAAADEVPDSPPSPVAPPSISSMEKPPTRERSATASGPTGVWVDHTGRGAVEITECAGRLCGHIVWLKDAGHKSVCGTQVIGNAKPVGKDTWDGGWIYDPDQNAKYSVELRTIGPDKLRVMGYMGSKLFSETFIWKRPTADLKRCDAPAATYTPSPAASDTKTAPTETTKAQPPLEQPTETAAGGNKPKSGNQGMGDIAKIARGVMKGNSGGKQCRANLPYVGNVTIPCPG
jgi:uncharacterized protein (DUF2147 family)